MRHALIRWLYRHGRTHRAMSLLKRNEAVPVGGGAILCRAVLNETEGA